MWDSINYGVAKNAKVKVIHISKSHPQNKKIVYLTWLSWADDCWHGNTLCYLCSAVIPNAAVIISRNKKPMTLQTILLFLVGLTLYWLMKIYNAKKKYKETFSIAKYLTNNLLSIVITLLGGVACYFLLPALSSTTLNENSMAIAAGYLNGSVLKFISSILPTKS